MKKGDQWLPGRLSADHQLPALHNHRTVLNQQKRGLMKSLPMGKLGVKA